MSPTAVKVVLVLGVIGLVNLALVAVFQRIEADIDRQVARLFFS